MGLGFFDACCRILTFSWPREGVIGNFSALADAIDSDMIPVLSSNNHQHLLNNRVRSS